MSVQETDFIVSELLSELKAENERKERQIKRLSKTVAITVISALLAVLMVIAGFLLYLNQYDFSATTTETYTNTAEGVYAMIDSEGNVISSDLTYEDVQDILKGVTVDGESNKD